MKNTQFVLIKKSDRQPGAGPHLYRAIKLGRLTLVCLFSSTVFLSGSVSGQTVIEPANKRVAPNQIMPAVKLTVSRFLDQANGTTADQAVRIALENNGEIRAQQDELNAAESLIKQAELRPNPRLRVSGSHESFVGNRYTAAILASLPLELGGRRRARINVAESGFNLRKEMLANSKRRLATEVRKKFGESLAKIKKLRFLEELLANVEQGYKIISAKVSEGSNAPLEQNMSLVELNRVRSMREMTSARVETKLLELRNIMGVEHSEPLRIKGSFGDLTDAPPTLSEALKQGVRDRPDLQALRLTLTLAKARLEQARASGRLDANVLLGFQRLTRVTPRVTNQAPVELTPQLVGENFITFGMDFTIPVRNKNRGAIESAAHNIKAAEKRIDFGELTVKREISAAYTRFRSAVRSLTIYKVGVRQQAKDNLLVVWQTYEFGDKDLIDYITEERRYLALENDLIDAELDVYLAQIDIYGAINSPRLIV